MEHHTTIHAQIYYSKPINILVTSNYKISLMHKKCKIANKHTSITIMQGNVCFSSFMIA